MTTTQTPEGAPSPFGDGVTHSHPNDVDPEAFEVVTVSCAQCGTEQRFTVPKSHLATGVRIKWNCPLPCDTDQFTAGKRPEEDQVTVTLSPKELEAIRPGRHQVIQAADSGAGDTSTSAT